jgi:hypothetical protein
LRAWRQLKGKEKQKKMSKRRKERAKNKNGKKITTNLKMRRREWREM